MQKLPIVNNKSNEVKGPGWGIYFGTNNDSQGVILSEKIISQSWIVENIRYSTNTNPQIIYPEWIIQNIQYGGNLNPEIL